MPYARTAVPAPPAVPPLPSALRPSPLMLCDKLITLAQDADRAGFPAAAGQLVHLAHVVLEAPRPIF